MTTSPSAVNAPKQLGRFEVGAKIGGGGMASVYLGNTRRSDGSEQVVALKVIRDEFATDPQFSGMFIDEAKILARLNHPNVIRTLEYGIDGVHRYIAMELLTGRTFADVWDLLVHTEQRLPVEIGAYICARTAQGLHSAHELVDATGAPLNVIHRDVNPSNIFLTHAGEVKLIDFGLAKARRRLARSADGIVKGKIPYLAPEQARGGDIDRRTDIYALGATLWESVTMRRLFKRDTDVATLEAIRDAHVPDVRTIVSGVPDMLWHIIDKALRRDPNERFATADEMRDALDRFVASTAAMKGALAVLVSELFPGEEREQEEWARAATAIRAPNATMPPPAPVPIASSSLLEDVESDPDLDPGDRHSVSTITARMHMVPPPSAAPASVPTAPFGPPTPVASEGAPQSRKNFWLSVLIAALFAGALLLFLAAR